MWEIRINHPGLNAYRVVKGQTKLDAEIKAASQIAVWDERWERRLNAERLRTTRSKAIQQRQASKAQIEVAKLSAIEQTRELEQEREALEGTLLQGVSREIKTEWELKKDRSPFALKKPRRPDPWAAPIEPAGPHEFLIAVESPNITLFDRLLSSRREKKEQEHAKELATAKEYAERRFAEAKEAWQKTVTELEKQNTQLLEEHRRELREWEKAKADFAAQQEDQHRSVDEDRRRYLAHEPALVERYIEELLTLSPYPDAFPRECHSQYIESTRTLVIDYELPNQDALPKIKEVKFIASRSEFQEVPTSDAWLRKTYDELLYQIALRTLYELFVSDEADALTSIVFNGWVRSIDRSTGSETHACIMSLEARKDEFLAINLRHVDAKACFKKLKGVAASKLIELSPVKPLVILNKEDSRFIEGYSVAESLDERTNLAAMDWQDFENLIREVFEREFSKGGGEVKITQASRDGGVDAVAFDPDPIRGGKLVIQAKRYTNTVGVSAVRDLFGTVHNEGANKGILVTTSDFGPDAYAFAKDKPLTLISGGELLYLLSQHGHAAKIDLAEAKRLAAEAVR